MSEVGAIHVSQVLPPAVAFIAISGFATWFIARALAEQQRDDVRVRECRRQLVWVGIVLAACVSALVGVLLFANVRPIAVAPGVLGLGVGAVFRTFPKRYQGAVNNAWNQDLRMLACLVVRCRIHLEHVNNGAGSTFVSSFCVELGRHRSEESVARTEKHLTRLLSVEVDCRNAAQMMLRDALDAGLIDWLASVRTHLKSEYGPSYKAIVDNPNIAVTVALTPTDPPTGWWRRSG